MKKPRIIPLIFSSLFLAALNIHSATPYSNQGKMKFNFDADVFDNAGIEALSEIVSLTNIKASEIEPFIKSRLSRYGTVQVNDALNMIIITDMPPKVYDLAKLVKKLDVSGLKEFVHLNTETIYLKYTQASVIKPLITTKLSPEGNILVDDDHNSLVITDVLSKINLIKELISELDKKIPQVMIEVKIVEINKDYSSKVGVDWNSITGILPQAYSLVSEDKQEAAFSLSNARITHKQFSGNLNLFELNNLINIMVNDGNAKVLSSPKIVTVNNKAATIFSGDNIFFTSEGNSSESAGNVGLTLNVTPLVKSENLINLNIATIISSLNGWSPKSQPIISTRNINSTIEINDKQTYVMGGLERTTFGETVKGIPLLKNLPILKIFFSRKIQTQITNELLVFITPKIMQEGEGIPRESLEKLDNLQEEIKKLQQ